MNELKFEHSAEIDKICQALAKIHGKNLSVKKSETAGSGNFGYKYAGLDGILEILRPELEKNKIAFTQHPLNGDEGKVGIFNFVVHESGQWIKSYFEIAIDPTARMNLTQKYGSAISYARRYCTASIFNIALEDDDGQSLKGEEKPKTQQKARTTQPAKQDEPKKDPFLTDAEKDATFKNLNNGDLSEEDRIKAGKAVLGKRRMKKEVREEIKTKIEDLQREIELRDLMKEEEGE